MTNKTELLTAATRPKQGFGRGAINSPKIGVWSSGRIPGPEPGDREFESLHPDQTLTTEYCAFNVTSIRSSADKSVSLRS